MVWTCQRVTAGERCGRLNENRYSICRHCGKKRPAKRKPAHMAALDLPYEHYIQLQGGAFCGICGAEPTPHRRLDRDHDHRTGEPRGLLCVPCNRRLDNRATIDWVRKALAYLERTQP